MSVPLRYNVRSILERKTRTALTVLGIAAVVATFVAMGAFEQGLAASFGRVGSPDNVVVLQKGAFNQSLSSLPRSSGDVIPYAPHVRKRGNRILASPELAIEPWVAGPGTSEAVFMQARGVSAVFFEVADTVVVTQGAPDLRGNRVLMGRGAGRKLGGVGPGATLTMFGERWTVTGLFESGGTNLEFEILADLSDLMRAANRDEYTSFTLKADDPSNVGALVAALEGERRVLLTALPEPEYHAGAGRVYAVVGQMGLLVSLIVAVGAVFGGMNTMYAAVAGRMREIGTLRALGFSRRSILVSFLVESLLLSVAGGVLGVALGSLASDAQVSIRMANVRFTVGVGVVLWALLLSFVVGLLGGLLPARQAARAPIVEALRGA